MIAKVIVWGNNRTESISRMKRALSEIKFEGLTTNVPFFLKLLNDEKFIKGDISTSFIAEMGV